MKENAFFGWELGGFWMGFVRAARFRVSGFWFLVGQAFGCIRLGILQLDTSCK